MPRKCCVYGCKSNYESTEVRYLSIKLYINGILIHVSQLHWIIGHTNNALSCWTQLFDIIKRYNVAPVPDIMSKSAFLADTIKCYLNFKHITWRVVLDYTDNLVAVIIWYQ